ncbi:MAG TPA: 2-hydroxyacid dehydrogenase [Ensifer sp.]|nr:2-hydroxyacid dehydrogenase [Ensifer sp.]
MDVILHVLKPLPRALLERAKRLKLVQKIGVGVDTIDLDAARALGIGVANMPGANAQAVAEHAIALMLAVLRQVTTFDLATRSGHGWSQPPALYEKVGEIAGRTVGFVGFGDVPKSMAPVLSAFGARMLYFARSDHPGQGAKRVPLDQLLAEADIVTLHVPLTSETREIIRAETLSRMKDGAILINTARGALVNETDLLAALASGKLMGAGLDVFAQEPVSARNELLALPNVVASPHLAWLTPETFARSLSIAFENANRAVAGRPLLNEIAPVLR